MSGIFKKFRKDDIEITPFEAHKEYYIHIENSTGSYFEKNYEQHRIIDELLLVHLSFLHLDRLTHHSIQDNMEQHTVQITQ